MQKKNGISLGIIILIFILGVAVLLYPVISSIWSRNHQLTVVREYTEAVESADHTEIDRELEEAETYNRSLLENGVVLSDPFDPFAPSFPDGNYLEMLDLNEAMAYVEIPAISVNLPIYHGTDLETLSKGVGHLEGTSLPIGGIGTHCVLSAHSGLPTAELFTNLNKLVIGDVFYIHVYDVTLAYKVNSIEVVEPSDITLLMIEEDHDYVTLITCTPYAVNTHRLLVRGERIEYDPDKDKDDTAPQETTEDVKKKMSAVEITQNAALSIGIVLIGVMISLIIKPKVESGRKKHEKKKK